MRRRKALLLWSNENTGALRFRHDTRGSLAFDADLLAVLTGGFFFSFASNLRQVSAQCQCVMHRGTKCG